MAVGTEEKTPTAKVDTKKPFSAEGRQRWMYLIPLFSYYRLLVNQANVFDTPLQFETLLVVFIGHMSGDLEYVKQFIEATGLIPRPISLYA